MNTCTELNSSNLNSFINGIEKKLKFNHRKNKHKNVSLLRKNKYKIIEASKEKEKMYGKNEKK